jgi:hypothetical protein
MKFHFLTKNKGGEVLFTVKRKREMTPSTTLSQQQKDALSCRNTAKADHFHTPKSNVSLLSDHALGK